MISIANAIYDLLHEHDTVIVPGLGAFRRHDVSAHVNVITHQFEKPSAIIIFDALEREDKELLYQYYARKNNIDEEEALQVLKEFVSEGFDKMKAGEKVVIDGVGTLWLNSQQELVFQAVDDNDFNGEAFGLCDLNPQPVYQGREQNNLTNPVRTGKKRSSSDSAVTFGATAADDDDRPSRRRWWLIPLILILLAGIAFAVYRFLLQPVGIPDLPPIPTVIVDTPAVKNDTLSIKDTLSAKDTPLVNKETLPEKEILPKKETLPEKETLPKKEPLPEKETVPVTDNSQPSTPEQSVTLFTPPATSKSFIVGGCFSIKENAENQVNSLWKEGFKDAFVMLRGGKYYVCYGHYTTASEASKALPQVRNSNPKAWILTKK